MARPGVLPPHLAPRCPRRRGGTCGATSPARPWPGSSCWSVPSRALFERLSVAVYCLPLLAIGPILQIVTTGSSTKIVLAALSVFFTTLVCCVLGLRSADPASLDVVHAAGGGKLRMFSAVRVQAALPSVFAGLRIAAPGRAARRDRRRVPRRHRAGSASR